MTWPSSWQGYDVADATDDFNRAGPAIGASWTLGINSIVISASTVVTGGTLNAENTAWRSLETFGGDHYAECVMSADSDGGGPVVRHQSGANTFYVFATGGGATCAMYESTAGTFAQLGADYANNAANGNTLRLDATGSTLTPSINGTGLATRSDASITGGAPGIHVFSTAMSFTSWLGGPISAATGIPNKLYLVNFAIKRAAHY